MSTPRESTPRSSSPQHPLSQLQTTYLTLERALIQTVVAKVVNALGWGVLSGTIALYLAHLVLRDPVSGQVVLAHHEVWVGAGVIGLVGLGTTLGVLWLSVTSSDRLCQKLDAQLVERGAYAQISERTLLTTLWSLRNSTPQPLLRYSTYLGWADRLSLLLTDRQRVWCSTSASSSLAHQIDSTVLLAINARAQPLLRALPKVIVRPAWELFTLALVSGVWLWVTIDFRLEEAQALAGSRGEIPQITRTPPQNTSDSLASKRQKNSSPPSLKAATPITQRSTPQLARPDTSSTSSQSSDHLTADTPQADSAPLRSTRPLTQPPLSEQKLTPRQVRRAQIGGRASRTQVNHRAHHAKRNLTPRSPNDSSSTSAQRDELIPRITSTASELSIGESAYLYGAQPLLTLYSFPPHLHTLELGQE